jgi:23S rRNA pseudouridine2605 synthase
MGYRKHQKFRRSESRPSPIAERLSPAQGVRLQKVIADAGVASRRKAEELITSGRVTVNGQIIRELGTRVDPDRDHVKVDGRHLRPPAPQTFIMLNKPKGVLSTLSDPEGRPTIKDLLHGVSMRVFPVGRLDYDTEGLLLLTNDGEIAQALLHPRYHVPKMYSVKVKGVLSDKEIGQLEHGIKLEDGMTAPALVKKVRKTESNSWIELTIHEGRTHQVKRMLEAVGHPVLKLERVRFGPLALGDLQPAEFRFLTDREANALREVVAARVRREASGVRRGQDQSLSGSDTAGIASPPAKKQRPGSAHHFPRIRRRSDKRMPSPNRPSRLTPHASRGRR